MPKTKRRQHLSHLTKTVELANKQKGITRIIYIQWTCFGFLNLYHLNTYISNISNKTIKKICNYKSRWWPSVSLKPHNITSKCNSWARKCKIYSNNCFLLRWYETRQAIRVWHKDIHIKSLNYANEKALTSRCRLIKTIGFTRSYLDDI